MKSLLTLVSCFLVFHSSSPANDERTFTAVLWELDKAGMSYPKSLRDGDLYVSIGGGFAGQITEVYVPFDRETIRVSKAYPPFGERSEWIIARKILEKKNYAHLLKLVEKVANGDLPPEGESITADDASWILVAKKAGTQKSGFKYCARTIAGSAEIEIDLRRCFVEMLKFEFPKNANKLTDGR